MTWRLAILLFWSSMAAASPLFEDDEVIDVELTGPLSQLIDNKESREEYPFTLQTNGVTLELKARVRGKSRLRVCNFPPIRLNFEDAGDKPTVFAGQNKLKLVTHCGIGNATEKNLLAEYAAFRIFGLFSNAAYRVRLLRITYVDSGEGTSEQHYGFVIETTDRLSERLGGENLKRPGVALSQLNDEQAALVYVFQYLIGNTDWSLVSDEKGADCCHNVELIEVGGEIYLVPYDFDLAGLVDAPYAKADPSLRLNSVRSRLYRGYCTDGAELESALQNIRGHEESVYRLVYDIPGLTDKQKKRAVSYLEDFFDKAEDQEKLLKSFEKKCLS
jgi:hypothetical protein